MVKTGYGKAGHPYHHGNPFPSCPYKSLWKCLDDHPARWLNLFHPTFDHGTVFWLKYLWLSYLSTFRAEIPPVYHRNPSIKRGCLENPPLRSSRPPFASGISQCYVWWHQGVYPFIPHYYPISHDSPNKYPMIQPLLMGFNLAVYLIYPLVN